MFSLVHIIKKYPKATDIHLTRGEVVRVRVNGRLTPLNIVADASIFDYLIRTYFQGEKLKEFRERGAADTSFSEGGYRFRFHLYSVRGVGTASIRVLPSLKQLPPDSDEEWIKEVASLASGLVLITGPTGSGKTTLLARIIDAVNKLKSVHLIMLEDPVEYEFISGKALIHQREKERDFLKFSDGIRAALREDPDIIVVGDMRDSETMRAALLAADTGHLVLATMHSSRAVEAISRVVHAFPADEQDEIRMVLSSVLRSISAQLFYKREGESILLREILMMTPAIARLIRDGRDEQIRSYMGLSQGSMRTIESRARAISRTWEEKEKQKLAIFLK